MNNIYFYITGLLTAFFAFLSWYYAKNIKTLKNNILGLNKEKDELIRENSDLKSFKERRKSKQRKAVFIWDGWHKEKDPSYKWKVTFNLKEVARSESNPNLYQFEVESIISGNDRGNDTWGLKQYSECFIREMNGGWMDVSRFNNNKKFHWVITESKEVLRDDKLEELGIK